MAQRRTTNQQRRSPQRRQPQRTQSRRRQTAPKTNLLDLFRKKQPDFRPDETDSGLLKLLYLTQVQRDRLAKWGSYALLVILLLVIQDVIMSRIPLFGTTTDLAVCAILLITVIEGVETGSVFVLIASSLYYFSGSSPGPLCIALLSVLGILACVFRQMWLHRSHGSIVLCAGTAMMVYEVAVYLSGIFQGLTRWDRIGAFLITGALGFALMIPLYSLVNKIGQIGGNPWKE